MANLMTSSALINAGSELNWADSISRDINWLNNGISETEENEDIVERFTFMSNINRSIHNKTDREEIRRRLAMGSDYDEYYNGERINKKPNLQSRLQSGMNLQICFMNETTSDSESITSDSEIENGTSTQNSANLSNEKLSVKRPDSLFVNKNNFKRVTSNCKPVKCLSKIPISNDEGKKVLMGSDFLSCQAQLQAEARLALIQAKEMAHMQMVLERQKQDISPITEIMRKSLEKVGILFSSDRRRLSRQMLTEMNIAQLQIIANELHAKIEILNEKLVRYLIGRDDLHMEQDSMLVDIEDLTRYLDANRCGT